MDLQNSGMRIKFEYIFILININQNKSSKWIKLY